ncbi:replicative DNA helicase [Pleurocapsales cyanobacterium LEGE 10410]|nr:replicative DNA helicase [Pleurocapsales cyanobacterium LEGE 10410]
MAEINNLPPASIEAEEAILGGILFDPDAITRVAELIVKDAFYVKAHQEIYHAALNLNAKGKPTDFISLSTYLSDRDLLEQVGGTAKLAQLLNRTVSAVNIDRYANLVMEKYIRRQLITSGHEIVDLGYDNAEELEVVLDSAEQKIFRLTQERPQEGLIPIAETLVNTFNTIEELHQETALPGVPSGYYDLDAMTSGFSRSDLIIIAGRPSMGKTAFALCVASNIARDSKLPIAIFSLEMSREQLTQRLLSSEAKIPSNRLRSGRISQNEFEPLINGVARLSELPIYIDDTANLTVMQMRSQVRRLQAQQKVPLGLVMIDYLQLMEGGDNDNRVQQLSKMTRSLKGLARELNVPIVALSQLSRGVEQRTNKRPMLSDLRESGCLSGDSLVTMADTRMRVAIKDLVGKSGFKVWALDRTTQKIQSALVSNAFATGVKSVFSLQTALGRKITATANHKFLTIHGWKRLDELVIGDYLAVPRTLSSPSTSSMSQARLALLGHLIGDGCTLPRHAIQYTTKEKDLADLVVLLAREIFGDSIKPRVKLERRWYQVYLSANYRLTHKIKNPITIWFEELGIFGLRSYQKFVPEIVFQQSQESIAIFLRHLWVTDGCIKLVNSKRPTPAIYYSSSSEKLARDVQSLILRLEINARLSLHPQEKGKNQYHVTVSGKADVMRFIELVGTISSYKTQELVRIKNYLDERVGNTNRDTIPHDIWRMYAVPFMQKHQITSRQMQSLLGNSYCGTSLYKQNISRERASKLATVVKSQSIQGLADSDLYWDKIVSIEAQGKTEVYDLTVPDRQNFVANDIIVHNSIEQDADLVMMIYRDEYYNPDTPDRGITEVSIVKHRNGPVGTVKLLFNAELTKFESLAKPTGY